VKADANVLERTAIVQLGQAMRIESAVATVLRIRLRIFHLAGGRDPTAVFASPRFRVPRSAENGHGRAPLGKRHRKGGSKVRRLLWLCVLLVGLLSIRQPAHAGFKLGRTVDKLLFGLENRIGQQGASQLEHDKGLVTDPQLVARVQDVAGQLIPWVPRKDVTYHVGILQDSTFNAMALPGGYVYVNYGLLRHTVSKDELAFVLAHELTHVSEKHGLKRLKGMLAVSLLDRLLRGQISDSDIAQLAVAAIAAKYSRQDEKEADLNGVELMSRAGYNPAGALTAMRRMETLHREQPDIVQALLATHPPPQDRSEYLKDKKLIGKYGRTFRQEAPRKEPPLHGPYKNSNTEWQHAFRLDTGWEPDLEGNPFRYRGECTWFTWAVRVEPEHPPARGNARDWWQQLVTEKGYGQGHLPKAGAIAYWPPSPRLSLGHVGLLTRVYYDGTIEVWDSNWGKEGSKDEDYTNGMVRHRVIDPRKENISYIYWPEGREIPPGDPRDRIALAAEAVHLGDDTPDSQTSWDSTFRLLPQDLEGKQNAAVTLKVRATPRKDPVISFNRVVVGRAVTSQTEWQYFEFPVPLSILAQGLNLVDLETVIPDLEDTFDDCEVSELTLILR